jgi:putative ABC transport system permease protein
MIFKNLLRRKVRTLLTVLGISIGVAAIISLGALSKGLTAGYNSMLSGSKADFILSQSNNLDVSMSSLDESIGTELADFPEVKEVSPLLEGFVQAEGAPYFFVFGYPTDSFVLKRFQIVEGSGLGEKQAGTKEMHGKPLILGSAAAESLKKSPGDSIRLGISTFRVIGIYETGDAFEDGGAVFDLADAQELLDKQRKVSLFYVNLKESADRERFQTRAERKWPKLSLSGTQEFADKQMMGATMDVYTILIAGLAIVLGGVGMMNSQLMSVFERTREIGVLRALGWSKRRVLWMILGETVVVCLAGGLIGIGLGWLVVDAVSSRTVMMGMDTSSIGADLVVRALVVVLVLGVSGGLYPAWKASKLQPVEALRYEGGSSGERVHRLPVGGMAAQSLWQRSTRSLLTLTVISLTIGSIILLEGLIRGMVNQMTGMAVGNSAQIIVRQADIADTSQSAMDQRIGDKIEAMNEVESVSGLVFTGITMPEAGGFFIVLGYSPNEYAIRNVDLIEGQTLTNDHQILLGKKMADALKKKVGSSISLSGSRFKIVGIYQSSVSYEELGGIISLRAAQAFTGRPRKVTMYGIRLKNPSQAQAVSDKINRTVDGAYAALTGDFANQLPDMKTTYAMMNGISLLAIVVGGLGVMNTMLMAVYERTREIGVLRALGWRRKAVLEMIMKESLLLAGLGAGLGMALGLALGFWLQSVPMWGQMLTPEWAPDIFARAVLVALLLGLAGGGYPAFRATRLQPVEALRYE